MLTTYSQDLNYLKLMLYQLEQTMSKEEIEEGEKYNMLKCLEDIKGNNCE